MVYIIITIYSFLLLSLFIFCKIRHNRNSVGDTISHWGTLYYVMAKSSYYLYLKSSDGFYKKISFLSFQENITLRGEKIRLDKEKKQNQIKLEIEKLNKNNEKIT